MEGRGEFEVCPATFNTFNDFVNYIYAHNNITWRNFNVVGLGGHRVGGHFHGFIPLRFVLSGAWDKPYKFAFETYTQLPQGSRMALQVPQWLGRGMQPSHTNMEEHEDSETDPDDRRRVRIPLHPHGPERVGQIELHDKTAAASHLLVYVPDKHRDQPYEVAIRQLYAGREVGRITWRLVPAL